MIYRTLAAAFVLVTASALADLPRPYSTRTDDPVNLSRMPSRRAAARLDGMRGSFLVVFDSRRKAIEKDIAVTMDGPDEKMAQLVDIVQQIKTDGDAAEPDESE